MIGTVHENQDSLLKAISSLYLQDKCFELDPCFNKGSFYKNWLRPKYIGDIQPKYKWCPKMDVTNLPWELWNLESAVFDPPFLVGTGDMAIRYGGHETVQEMFQFFSVSLEEFHRVLRPGGTLVVKIQDSSVGGQNFWGHINIANTGRDVGFELIDLFILVNKIRQRDKKKVPRMAVKEHCYFMVFKKVERQIRVPKF